MGMRFTMGLNLMLLVAMVAANILSLYHLTSTLQSQSPTGDAGHQAPVPEHLLLQLQTIRATINRLNRLQEKQKPPTNLKRKAEVAAAAAAAPPDLLLYSNLAPIASSCHDYPDLLHQYMTYSPFSLCPPDYLLAEALILRGCHPLPRRRCFSATPPNPSPILSSDPFPPVLSDSDVIWRSLPSSCKSFKCLDPALGFHMPLESKRFMSYNSGLDLTVSQLITASITANSPIRIGIDIGGGTGTFAARMKLRNVTILTTTMDLGAPFSEAAALRGVVPLHAPLQQRLPVFDGTVDLVRCGRAVNRWIPFPAMEFLLFDADRVLRNGGFLWLDHFFSKGLDLDKLYKPLIGKLGYKIVKWATGNKTDSARSKNGEVYLTALLHKPDSR